MLHLSEEKRGDRDPAQGVVRVLVLQGRTAQRFEPCSRKDWSAYAGRAMDQIHLASGDCGRTVDPEGVPLRSHRIGGVRDEDRPKEAFRVPNSCGVAEEAR